MENLRFNKSKVFTVIILVLLNYLLFTNTRFVTGDANEPDDAPSSFEEALEVIPEIAYNGTIGDGDTADCYKASIEDGDKVTVTVNKTSNNYDRLTFTLHSNSIYPQQWQMTSTGVCSLTRIYKDTNWFYFYFNSSLDADIIDYWFFVDILSQNDGEQGSTGDAGDSFQESTLVSSNSSVKGMMGFEDKKDAYKVSISRCSFYRGNISISTGIGKEITYKMLNADNDILEMGTINSTKSLKCLFYQPFFVILLEVTNTPVLNYTIESEVVFANDGNSQNDAGSSFENAIDLDVNKTYSGFIGKKDTRDFYSFSPSDFSHLVANIVIEPTQEEISWQITWFDEDGDYINTTSYIEKSGGERTVSMTYNESLHGSKVYLLIQTDNNQMEPTNYLIKITSLKLEIETTTESSQTQNNKTRWLSWGLPLIILGVLILIGLSIFIIRKYRSNEQ
jgi:hypothetical protein